MNIFRLIGDFSHVRCRAPLCSRQRQCVLTFSAALQVLAIVLLLAKIWKTRSAAGESTNRGTSWVLRDPQLTHPLSSPGISGKSQILFTITYITRCGGSVGATTPRATGLSALRCPQVS